MWASEEDEASMVRVGVSFCKNSNEISMTPLFARTISCISINVLWNRYVS